MSGMRHFSAARYHACVLHPAIKMDEPCGALRWTAIIRAVVPVQYADDRALPSRLLAAEEVHDRGEISSLHRLNVC